jgi:glucan 1,3-beta-glucosidase
MANPQVMLMVGSEGSTETVEISDILFTSIGALSRLIMVEWIMAAETQGSVGLWDSHFRVGGATGTKMQASHSPFASLASSHYFSAHSSAERKLEG